MELKIEDDEWRIDGALLHHEISPEGDSFRMEISIRRNSDYRNRRCEVMTPEVFSARTGLRFEGLRGEHFTLVGSDRLIGFYRTANEDETFSLMRSTNEAIYRMAQIIYGHAPLNASVTLHENEEKSAGFITAFKLQALKIG